MFCCSCSKVEEKITMTYLCYYLSHVFLSLAHGGYYGADAFFGPCHCFIRGAHLKSLYPLYSVLEKV